MGDFDSLGYRPDHPNVETHPVMKDDTDLGLARCAGRWRTGIRRLRDGGRMLGGPPRPDDCEPADAARTHGRGAQGWLIGCGWVVTAVQNGTLTFPAGMEGTVSVFSSGDAARGVTLRGLLYEITDAELRCAMPLGVSNSFTGAAATGARHGRHGLCPLAATRCRTGWRYAMERIDLHTHTLGVRRVGRAG